MSSNSAAPANRTNGNPFSPLESGKADFQNALSKNLSKSPEAKESSKTAKANNYKKSGAGKSNLKEEVFFDDARAPAENILGRRGEGWAISRATLKHERNLIGNPRLMTGQFEVLLQTARRVQRNGRPAIEDPAVRDRLAEIECHVRACETTNLRMLSATARGEELQVMLPMMMIKLFSTEVMKKIAETSWDLLGSDGLLEPAAANDSIYDTSAEIRGVVHNYLYSLGPAIAGGASNIQRNIIGERGLGLPRDLRP
jgi:alkylation response protein AidB-like acyl-CoA dehydrogenase